jgi:phosphate transport system permease protein
MMKDRLFVAVCFGAAAAPLVALLALFGAVLVRGLPRLSWTLLSSFPSRHADEAGLLPALAGSALLVLLTAAFAVPIGVGAAVWLEEYGTVYAAHGGRGRWLARIASLLELNVKNHAGVPSVVYGVLGFAVFVRALGLGRSLIAGALTLALLVLPIIVVATREALRTVPLSLREQCLALGATRWQAIRRVVVPTALPGIATAVILALSRALGETAPLVVVGALTYVTFLPDGIDAPYTALPIQIWSWVSRPQDDFVANAAAGVVVLLALLAVTNAAAVILRDRASRWAP